MKTLSLEKWKVCGFWPYEPFIHTEILSGSEREGVTHWMDTTPRKSLYKTLQEYRLIEDPYAGCNSLQCEWVSNRWWVYKTTFHLDADWQNTDALEVCFEGIDYKAHVYLNGQKLGEHEGVCLPFTADIAPFVRFDSGNTLVCVVESAPDEYAKFGYTPKVKSLKPRYNYYWDFSTRLVSIGLYGAVQLHGYESAALRHTRIHTRPVSDSTWELSAQVELDCFQRQALMVRAVLSRNGISLLHTHITATPGKDHETFRLTLPVDHPALWWPNGLGEPALYRLDLYLEQNGHLLQEKSFDVGFREVRYEKADKAPEDALPYQLVVNGHRVYIKGANLVPLDLLAADVTAQRTDALVEAAQQCGVNLFRIWGGGMIESECLYRACSRRGIMIWQEFMQSSSGLDDVPGAESRYLELLRKVSLEAIQTKRNHPCLVYWCGGNELCNGESREERGRVNDCATYADANLAMLNGLVAAYDPERLFLPTSGSGGHKLLDIHAPAYNYDVHGPWQYAGVQEEYTLFNQSNSIWNTEYGCGGLCNPESAEKILGCSSPPLAASQESLLWRHHGGHWDKTLTREAQLFGAFAESELPVLARCSQFIQGEAIRYGMEENRRKAFRNTGTILWEFNDPFPNLHSASIVDYYGGKKLAYYMFADACRPQAATLRYHALVYQPGETFLGEIFTVNDLAPLTSDIRCSVIGQDGRRILEKVYPGHQTAFGAGFVDALQFPVSRELGSAFRVELCLGELRSCYLFFAAESGQPLDRGAVEHFYEDYLRNRR